MAIMRAARPAPTFAGLACVVAGFLLGHPAEAWAQSAVAQPIEVACPSELGVGVETGRLFCDVVTGLDPAAGIIVKIPGRRGTPVLSFDLHNRHTYSEQAVQAGTAYSRYTATIGVLTMENTLIQRATIESEFRSVGDAVDRIGGGAGDDGLKAIVPTGAERIYVELPSNVSEVSILGEWLEVIRREGRERYTAPGRPIAIVSNVAVERRARR
jgi:hypothetical protein